MTIVADPQEAHGVRWEMGWRLRLMRLFSLLEPLWRAALPKQSNADEGISIVVAGAFLWALRVLNLRVLNLMIKTP